MIRSMLDKTVAVLFSGNIQLVSMPSGCQLAMFQCSTYNVGRSELRILHTWGLGSRFRNWNQTVHINLDIGIHIYGPN